MAPGAFCTTDVPKTTAFGFFVTCVAEHGTPSFWYVPPNRYLQIALRRQVEQYTFRQDFISRRNIGAKTLNATLIINVQWFRQPDYVPAEAIHSNLMGFFSGWADMVRLQLISPSLRPRMPLPAATTYGMGGSERCCSREGQKEYDHCCENLS
jgi:hypothetical protein